MAEYSELVQALTWLLTNRIQQKIEYTHGLAGDGNGRVRVSTIPNSPDVDYIYVRPDRFSNRAYKVFNKRVECQDGDPIIIGELPWEPDLIQVIDMDWAAYADVGWGDDVTTTNRHGISHQWRDGAPGIDTFNVYRRQFGDLKTYPAVSGTLAVGISPYSLDIYGAQYQWSGVQSFSLQGALPAGTGSARMVLVYWDPASGTSGYLGVASGTLGSSADATILNRPVTPQGAIPSAFVRLKGGQTSVTEFDIWDAREPFRPGIVFGTGTTGLSADKIPISDIHGLYTGSTVEAALDQIGYDGARVSKLYRPDFSLVALQSDANGNITINSTGTFTLPTEIIHAGDTDTKIGFTPDVITDTVGNKIMLRRTNTTQDLVEIGDVSGGGDVDVNVNAGAVFVQGSDGYLGVGNTTPNARLTVNATNADTIPFNLTKDTTSTTGTVEVARLNLTSSGTPTAPFGGRLTFFADNTAGTLGNKAAIVGGTDGASNVGFLLFQTTNTSNSLTDYMKINGSGDVGIGAVSSITAQLHVTQSGAGAAQPVAQFTQTDISEEIIWYEGESSAGSADMSLVDASEFTTPGALLGWVKKKVEDNRGGGGLGTIDAWMPIYAIPTA